MDELMLRQLLAQYDTSQHGDFQVLPSFANQVYLYQSDNQKYLIKHYQTLSYESVQTLHENLALLRNNAVQIPRVLSNKLGNTVTQIDNEVFEIGEYREHRDLNYQKYNITLQDLFLAGKILRRIHTSPQKHFKLETVNFKNSVPTIMELINTYQAMRSSKNLKDNDDQRLEIIDHYILSLSDWLKNIDQHFANYHFLKAENVVTHGDYSLINLLPVDAENTIYVIDWDHLRLRPAMFDLQRAIGLLCGEGKTNGNLDRINPERLKNFLNGYFGSSKPTNEEINQLVEVAEYVSHFDWLEFTLNQVIQGDYRILEILSVIPEENYFWLDRLNVVKYRELLEELLH